MASANPGIRRLTGFLEYLMDSARDRVPGPASEFIVEAEETTASKLANECNRVLRVTVEFPDSEPQVFDVTVNLAEPTIRKAGPQD
ncbi:hypothetical protein Sipo8835_37355 [Streptomyces ipomoeae]|uniref:Uncharacterized protein n=1 Tax=Streptomyces ipomoeae TaxID=103232 RepID=A0AAE8VVC3_9ACTN|nr:hypothetical protein [Streptomyces ipomoeae]TQE21622.1 hypothetical protein Sipo8835_37355 [Streptomyces ipomoeae]